MLGTSIRNFIVWAQNITAALGKLFLLNGYFFLLESLYILFIIQLFYLHISSYSVLPPLCAFLPRSSPAMLRCPYGAISRQQTFFQRTRMLRMQQHNFCYTLLCIACLHRDRDNLSSMKAQVILLQLFLAALSQSSYALARLIPPTYPYAMHYGRASPNRKEFLDKKCYADTPLGFKKLAAHKNKSLYMLTYLLIQLLCVDAIRICYAYWHKQRNKNRG